MEREKTEALKRMADGLFRAAETDKGSWAEMVRNVFPEILDAAYWRENERGKERRICSHARVCILTLASTMMGYIFPQGHRWFKFGVPAKDGEEREKDALAEDWFNRATDIAAAAIERSNFYPEMHGVTIDRCVTGTGLLLVEMDADERMLQFTHIPSGTYAIGENCRHEINTVVRKMKYTYAQLAEEFGVENLHPSVVSEMRGSENWQDVERTKEVWHIVMPRELYIRSYSGVNEEMRPWASVYIDPDNSHVLSEGGFYEFPYMCTRFVRYGASLYGTGPLMNVRDTIRDLMVDDDAFKYIVQRTAFPSLAITADLEGEIDLSPGSTTVIPMQYANMQMPRELAPSNPQALQQIIAAREQHKKEISDACFTSIFQNVSSQERQMSATEVNAREAEKAMNFYPTFTQLQSDTRVMFNRIFCLLMRSGELDAESAPEGVLQNFIDDEGVERQYVLNPRMVYVGKMSQAMERVQSGSAQNFFALAFQMFSALQNAELPAQFDWTYIMRDMAAKSGMPAKYLNTKEAADRLVQEVQRQIAAQQQAQAAAAQAEAERNQAQAENFRAQYR